MSLAPLCLPLHPHRAYSCAIRPKDDLKASPANHTHFVWPRVCSLDGVVQNRLNYLRIEGREQGLRIPLSPPLLPISFPAFVCFVVNSFCLDLDLQFHSFPPGSLPSNMGAMTKLRFLFISLLLVCAGLRTDAALFGGEKRDFELASESFRLQMWARAEKGFATFIKDHPKSEKLTDALLLQAEAMFRQKKFSETVTLLSARSADAGKASDQFLYWTAEAQFQNGNHREAATTFSKGIDRLPYQRPLTAPTTMSPSR